MTQTADPTPPAPAPGSPRRAGTSRQAPTVPHDLCPLLLADDGAWRRATAVREHRCAALGADVPLGIEKQRRLCLGEAHRTCATYATAMRLGSADGQEPLRRQAAARPYPRTAPVILDHGRIGRPIPRVRPTRTGVQVLLATLMVAAFAVIALTRFTAGEAGVVAGATSPIVAATSSPPASKPPATIAPSPTPSPVVTAPPVTPAPSAVRTYTVRRGDTLSGIAGEYGTTVKALMERNGITNPRQLRVGAVLELP